MLKRTIRCAVAAAGFALAEVLLLAAGAGPSLAFGQPEPGQMGLQQPATEVMTRITEFYDFVNFIIIAISAFVLLLMGYVLLRFNSRANPTPSKTTHNVLLEVAWTVIPIAVLVVIAIPSFKLLRLEYAYPKPDLTIKATGNAWYWDHEFIDYKTAKGKPIVLTTNMMTDEDVLRAAIGDKEFDARYSKLEDGSLERITAVHEAAKPVWAKRHQETGESRQLAVDTEIAVPVGKVVDLLITSNDVIHSWTIPAFGSKQQAVPGRISATWFRPDKTGMYYGQCSVLCGKNHSAMPIAVRVVPEAVFNDWMAALVAADSKKANAILKAEAVKQWTNVARAE